ncbi:MAG: hypothetical protein HC817_08340 [Saprospiraceae bacterium]|nr:hypothetical protein [Saprospiraceae bacterium]
MRISLIFALAFSINSPSFAQFEGKYTGTANGDNISLTLEKSGINTYKGVMKDSYQTFIVQAQINNNTLTGTAVENSLAITFLMEATMKSNQMPTNFTFNSNGQSQTFSVNFTKVGAPAKNSSTTASTFSNAKLPAGASHDPNLVGNWVKEEYYQSNYGSTMGGSFSQAMILYADGKIAEGNSRASISGSDYSGQSTGQGKLLPNLFWYNVGNQLYFQGAENGQTQTIHLGKYYIENGKILITGTNGNKLFMTKR